MKYFIFIVLLALLFLRFYTLKPGYKDGDNVRITAVVLSDPVRYSTTQYLRIAGLKIYLPLYPEVNYGDNIVVEGKVSGDKLITPKLIKISDKKTFLSGTRNKIIDFYQKVLPQPEAGLLAGVVIGSKGALSPDFYSRTKAAGVAHVVVASGTNITFLVSFLMGVLTLIMTRRKAILFVILGIILYLFLAGFDAPIIRAAIMSSFLFAGQEAGRVIATWRIFIITALLMLIYNPLWLTDIGFILSFVSTGSLMLFEKRIRRLLKLVPEVFKEGLSTSLAAQIGVAPILFVTFGQFNIWSPLINALVLWTIPYLMIIGSLGAVVGLIIPFLGKMIVLLSYPLLWWFVKVVSF